MFCIIPQHIWYIYIYMSHENGGHAAVLSKKSEVYYHCHSSKCSEYMFSVNSEIFLNAPERKNESFVACALPLKFSLACIV